MDLSFGVKDWLMILATVLGPIFAVQAQKYLERLRDHEGRKLQVFRSLMATRAERLSPEHVRSLNMIDLTFYGRRFPFFTWQTKSEKAVVAAWKTYHDHLATTPPTANEAAEAVFYSAREPLFIALLASMANDMRYPVDTVQLKKGAYSPRAHGALEDEQLQIRGAVLRVLNGDATLKFEVVSFPADAEALAEHKSALKRLNSALDGGALKVEVGPRG